MSAAPQKTEPGAQKIPVTVSAIVAVNELVTRFEFSRADTGDFPTFSGGAHTLVEMKDGDKTRLNPYSLMSDPADTAKYAISVRRDDEGRGGSLFLHKNVKVGDKLSLSYPVNLFSLDLRANKHMFFAGGIGITPFLSMIAQLERSNGNWELHYACRSASQGAYADELAAQYPNKVRVYRSSEGQKINFEILLDGQALGTHAYACGPEGFIDDMRSTATHAGWPQECLHSEEFTAPQPGQAFEVRLCKSDKTITVDEDESLLEAIERSGVDAPFLCRGGACGQCETDIVELDGELLHRDHWLEPDQQQKKIMPCVSRFIGKSLVLDR